jgi:phage protein D
MSNESPMHFVERFSQEFGGIWQVKGDSIILTKPGEDASGQRTDTIIAEWGKNLIGWKVHPWRARPGWSSSDQHYFDTRAGQWMKLIKDFGKSMPWSQSTAKYSFPAPAPNKSVAEQHNDGADLTGTYVPGAGRIVINGEPSADWNKHVQIIGARPGVDGTYFIWCAEHSYSRQGYITWLDVQPETEMTGPSPSYSPEGA